VELLKDAGVSPDMVAGHSLGEFAALSAAGIFTVSDCLRLVTERGRLMQNAALKLNGGMAAVKYVALPLLEEIVTRACPDIRIANFNSPDQLVVSGANNALIELAQQVTAHGGQVVPLPVAGPWHHPSMSEASLEFQSILDGIDFSTPRCPVYMNVSGLPETDPESIKDLVRVQMTSPVLWQTSVEGMFAAGARLFLEVGPGKVLRGLMRRIIPDESAYRVRGIENSRSLQFLSTEALR
jgi:[acyl-carrier-protein] S-malonyltransferase